MAVLSCRMQKPAAAILPKIEATIAERTSITRRIDLSTAENWLIRPEIVDICKDAIQNGLTTADLSYPDGFGGDPKLQEALAAFFNKYFDPVSPVQPGHILVGPGASDCLSSLLFSICEPGDDVLVMAPYWNGFDFHFVLRPNINIIPVHTEAGSRLDCPNQLLSDSLVPALDNALGSCGGDNTRVKALVLTNPHNPFARCYPEKVLREAIHWCADNGLHFISDEIYALSDFSGLLRSPTNRNGLGDEVELPDGSPPLNGALMNADGYVSLHSETRFVSALSLELEDDRTPPISVIWGTSKDLGSSGLRMGVHVSKPSSSLMRNTDKPDASPSLLSTSLGLLMTPQLPSISMLLTRSLLTSDKFDNLVVTNRERLHDSHNIITRRLRDWGIPFIPATAGPYLLAHLGIRLGDAQKPGPEKGVLNGSSASEEEQNGTGTRQEKASFRDPDLNVVEILRQEAMVLVSPSKSFHMHRDGAANPHTSDGWVRITFAVPLDVLEDGLRRIGETLGLGDSERTPHDRSEDA